MTIKVFKAEAEAGLQDAIQDNIVKASTSIKSFKRIKNRNDLCKRDREILARSNANANPDQIDLYYLETVLVSTGWNKNDDVFLPDETWKARHTPEDKMFNYMHNEGDIIGHMTGSYVEDFDGNLIPDDTPLEEIPADFNIITPAVIYAKWSDEERQERIDAIIDDIESGTDKWKVSMECLFPAFDYAAINLKSGEQLIIPRDSSSASLTKHLRVYGGEGHYQGYRLGRALRNKTFSGKGLVDDPANERSKVRNKKPFTDTVAKTTVLVPKDINWTAADVDISDKEFEATWATDVPTKTINDVNLNNQFEENDMADKTETVIADLKQELAQARSDLKEMQTEMDQKREEEVQAKTDELNDTIAEKDDRIEELETSLSEKEDELKDAKAEVEKAEKAKEDAEKQVAELEAEKRSAARKAELVSAGADEDEAESLVEEWSDASDEQFEKVVSLVEKANAESDDPDNYNKDKKKKDKKKSEASDDSDSDDDDDDASAALDDLEDDEESASALNSDSDDDEEGTQKLKKGLAKFFRDFE